MQGRVYLGRYETLRQIGEGGMGKVYLARNLELDEPVVVKVMHEHIAANPTYRERFKREMRTMARFQHPNAVQIHTASLDDPQGPCIIMEFLPGIGLEKLLAKNVRFNPARLHRFLGQLCGVLQAAHDMGIVHRDLKPANLMVLDADTPNEKLKVMDFGLAQTTERRGISDTKSTINPADFAVGTPGYMAPEQVRGEAVDHRSDLYSVGAILFQLLTGRLPFPGKTVMEILMAQATDGLPTFTSLGIDEQLSLGVEDVVRRALALQPDERPSSARELFEAYDAAVTGAHRGREKPVEKPDSAEPEPESEDASPETDATVEQLEAYMPEQIAAYKLQGFVEEVGGKIVQNSPGLIKVQLKASHKAFKTPARTGLLGWLGFGPRYGMIDMELHMKKKNVKNQNVLQITVLLRPAGGGPLPDHPDWGDRCRIITQALKAYLMSQ